MKLSKNKSKELPSVTREKIQQVEDKIKEAFFQKEEEDFWNYHIKPVIEETKKLAKKYGANEEIVWLAAILHDFGQLEALESHEEIGSKRAHVFLIEEKFSEEIAEKVGETILTHRCNRYFPETLEQKILATADALSHFKTPHYFWITHKNSKDFSGLLKKYAEKIERDLKEKIFFEEERKTVKKEFAALKKWFNYKI